MHEGKEVIVTTGDTAVIWGANRPMLQYDHEEADTRPTRFILHKLSGVYSRHRCGDNPCWHVSLLCCFVSICKNIGSEKSFTLTQFMRV